MFEAAVLLSKERKLRTTGVAAALQSGGACTLFAEAAGAAGLDLPEFSPTTRRRLAKVLPHFASQNNPLDVTGQAAVETEMFEGALEALANDMGVGFIAFDAFPPRLEGDAVGRPGPEEGRGAAARDRGGVRQRGDEPARLRAGGEVVHEEACTAVPARAPRIGGGDPGARRVPEREGAGDRRRPAAASRPGEGAAGAARTRGPIDEETGARILRLYGVARPKERTVASPEQAAAFARSIRFPVVVKAQAPRSRTRRSSAVSGSGCATRPTSGSPRPRCSRAAKRAGAGAPKVLVQQMVRGTEVLVGAVVDDRFGPMITVRPGGALAEGGEAVFVPCPLTPAQARAYMLDQASHCGLDPQDHDLRAAARAVEAIARIAHDLRGRLTSFEANPLLVGERGAVAVDALAEVRPG